MAVTDVHTTTHSRKTEETYSCRLVIWTWAPFWYKDCLSRYMGFPIRKMSLIFIMGISILVRPRLYIETASCFTLVDTPTCIMNVPGYIQTYAGLDLNFQGHLSRRTSEIENSPVLHELTPVRAIISVVVFLIIEMSCRTSVILIQPVQEAMGWVGLWGFLWWAPSATRKDHHGVSSG